MNLALMRGEYPPVVIGQEHRADYNDSLQALQVGGDPLAYQRFMTERLDASLDHHLFVLRGGQERAPTHVSRLGLAGGTGLIDADVAALTSTRRSTY